MQIRTVHSVAVVLTAVAFFFAAYSLTMQWYHYDYRVRTPLVDAGWGADYYADGLVTHLDYYEKILYSDNQAQMRDLMQLEGWLVFFWLMVGIAFLGACLLDNAFYGFIVSWVLVAICLMSVLAFAVNADEAVFGQFDAWPGGFEVPSTFFGSQEVDGGDASWGPSTGYLSLVLAALIQFVACFAKIGVSLNPLVRLFRPL